MHDARQTVITDQLLDAAAVAALLRCSVRNVRRLADSGKMPPCIRIGGLQRWRRVDLDRWLTSGAPTVRHVDAKPRKRGE